MTQDEMTADYLALRGMCLEVRLDDPMSVWWTLRNEHGAALPSKLMRSLIDKGTWDGFAGRYGISRYNNDGTAA